MPITNLQFIILGSGTSSGVPIIGCNCAVCTSTDPHDSRTRASAVLRFTDSSGHPRTTLIDASPDLRQQALRHKLDRCDAIIFTHNHVDHTFGLDEVRRFNALMDAPIHIYADLHTFDHLTRVFKHIFDRHKNINDSFVASLIPNLIAPPNHFDLLGLRFTPLSLLHGKLPVLGFRIEALNPAGNIAADQPAPLPLAYCTDVSSIPPETWPQLTNLNTLILDMLRFRHHPTHFTVDQAIDAASRIGAAHTYFTHMTHDISHADLDPRLPPTMHLAFDGLTIP